MIRRTLLSLLSGAALLVTANVQAAESSTREGIAQFHAAYRSWDADAFEKAAQTFLRNNASGSGGADDYHWLGVVRFHQMLQKQRGKESTDPQVVTYREAAINALTSAVAANPKDAEAHALLGTLLGMKIDGMVSALRYGPAVSRHRDQALSADAENPRVQYLLGTCLYHTAKNPAGYQDALKSLRTAESLFEKENKAAKPDLEQRWGYDACLVFIGKTHEALGETDKAAASFRKALSVRPADRLAAEGLKRVAAAR